MANIISSASLLEFKGNRRMYVGAFVNKETADTFKSCIFVDDSGNKCFVSFSSKLGELTPQQIAAQKHDLQVVTMDSGTHILCKAGANSWESVEL